MDVEREGEHRNRDPDQEKDDRRDDQGEHKPSLFWMESRTHKPPDLLDDHRARQHNSDVHGDLELEQHTASRLKVDRVADACPLD